MTPQELAAGRPGQGFRSLMEFEAARAHDYYQKASSLPAHIDPCSRSALRAMVAIYHRLLERIEQEDFRVFGQRVRVSTAREAGPAGSRLLAEA